MNACAGAADHRPADRHRVQFDRPDAGCAGGAVHVGRIDRRLPPRTIRGGRRRRSGSGSALVFAASKRALRPAGRDDRAQCRRRGCFDADGGTCRRGADLRPGQHRRRGPGQRGYTEAHLRPVTEDRYRGQTGALGHGKEGRRHPVARGFAQPCGRRLGRGDPVSTLQPLRDHDPEFRRDHPRHRQRGLVAGPQERPFTADGSDGLQPEALRYLWPGVVAQSVQASMRVADRIAPDNGDSYSISSFTPASGSMSGFSYMPAMLVMPDPLLEAADPAIRKALRRVADGVRSIAGQAARDGAPQRESKSHYRFYCFTDPRVSETEIASGSWMGKWNVSLGVLSGDLAGDAQAATPDGIRHSNDQSGRPGDARHPRRRNGVAGHARRPVLLHRHGTPERRPDPIRQNQSNRLRRSRMAR